MFVLRKLRLYIYVNCMCLADGRPHTDITHARLMLARNLLLLMHENGNEILRLGENFWNKIKYQRMSAEWKLNQNLRFKIFLMRIEIKFANFEILYKSMDRAEFAHQD